MLICSQLYKCLFLYMKSLTALNMQWLFHHYLTGSALGFVSLHRNLVLFKRVQKLQCTEQLVQRQTRTLLTGLCNIYVTLRKKPVITMESNTFILTDSVILCIFSLALQLPMNPGSCVCLKDTLTEEMFMNKLSILQLCGTLFNHKTTLMPITLPLLSGSCGIPSVSQWTWNPRQFFFSLLNEVHAKLTDETIEEHFGNQLQSWHARTTERRVCFAGLGWNVSENAVYGKSAPVCLSVLSVCVWMWNVFMYNILLCWSGLLFLCESLCVYRRKWRLENYSYSVL